MAPGIWRELLQRSQGYIGCLWRPTDFHPSCCFLAPSSAFPVLSTAHSPASTWRTRTHSPRPSSDGPSGSLPKEKKHPLSLSAPELGPHPSGREPRGRAPGDTPGGQRKPALDSDTPGTKFSLSHMPAGDLGLIICDREMQTSLRCWPVCACVCC